MVMITLEDNSINYNVSGALIAPALASDLLFANSLLLNDLILELG